jgi:hypothetical protein
MNAHQIVDALLEGYNPYDIDDPLDLPEYPGGFIATSPEGERWEVRLTELAGKPAYRWVKFWWNDYQNKLVPFVKGHCQVRRGNAEKYIKDQSAYYGNAGWSIEFL